MMDCRAAIASGLLLLAIVVALLIAIIPNRCNKTSIYDPDTEATRAMSVSAEAKVSSVEIFESEKREGMRKVRVRLTVERKGEETREIVITEWVPIVLLGRLKVGSSVQLLNDPVEDRMVFGL